MQAARQVLAGTLDRDLRTWGGYGRMEQNWGPEWHNRGRSGSFRHNSSALTDFRYPRLRELWVQYAGCPYRILYAFDPRRVAILLIGGEKTGEPRWYERMIPLADRLYDEHLEELRKEGWI